MITKSDRNLVTLALAEDIGTGDLTGQLLPPTAEITAVIVAQQTAVICGTEFVNEVFSQLSNQVSAVWFIQDGEEVSANTVCAQINGPAQPILAGERTALNFLQTLSGTATVTRRWVAHLQGTSAKLLDTRKTLPGLRQAQKYAVRCGGGNNHRMGLDDAILIKENHIAAWGSISRVVHEAKRRHPTILIEVEVRNLTELQEALTTPAEIIMLDNFSYPQICEAVALNHGQKSLEVSGGVQEENLRELALTGVDYISVGALTKTVVPVELSLLVQNLAQA